MPTDSNSNQSKTKFPIRYCCPDCDGHGEIEIGYYKHASFNRDVGEEYAAWHRCELCNGVGLIEQEQEDLD